jgi:hypothetical protein
MTRGKSVVLKLQTDCSDEQQVTTNLKRVQVRPIGVFASEFVPAIQA